MPPALEEYLSLASEEGEGETDNEIDGEDERETDKEVEREDKGETDSEVERKNEESHEII